MAKQRWFNSSCHLPQQIIPMYQSFRYFLQSLQNQSPDRPLNPITDSINYDQLSYQSLQNHHPSHYFTN